MLENKTLLLIKKMSYKLDFKPHLLTLKKKKKKTCEQAQTCSTKKNEPCLNMQYFLMMSLSLICVHKIKRTNTNF